MTVQLRPHHLLCLLTYAGKGYSPEFVSNLDQIVSRIAVDHERIEIVDGPDDVCVPMLSGPDCHCRSSNIQLRDSQATEALSELLQEPIVREARIVLSGDRLLIMRQAFTAGTIRKACAGCSWAAVCDATARSGFEGTRLLTGNLSVT